MSNLRPASGFINVEAERVLLASVLGTNAAYDDVADRVRPEHFGFPFHAQAWEAIGKIITKGGKAEPATIVSHISADAKPPEHETLAPEDYLGKKIRLLRRPREELREFVEALIHAHEGRKIAAVCSEYQKRAVNGEAGLLDQFSADVAELQDGAPAGTFRLIGGDVMAALESILEKRERSRGQISGISTGFPHLDNLLDGLRPSTLTVIGARPKQGKTSLAQEIILNVAKQGFPVAFFSLEMSRDELSRRMLSAESGIDFTRIQRGDLSDEEKSAVGTAAQLLNALPIRIEDDADQTPAAILSRARGVVAKHGAKLIIIDYLQRIKAGNPRANRYETVTDASLTIAQMAKSLKVPVIALAQLSRKGLERVNFDFAKFKPEMTRPHDGDLRESGQIEQDAHAVLFINRPYQVLEKAAPTEEGENMMAWREACQKWKRRAEISVDMNRSGETGTVDFIFKGETLSWKESPLQTYFAGSGLRAPLNFLPVARGAA